MKKRKIFAEIWGNMDSDDILLLNGARRTGKTTLLHFMKNKLIQERNVATEQIHWFDLERADDLALWSDQTLVLQNLPVHANKKQYIFIDEFQKSKTIGSTLKILHDHYPQVKCIITGSASWYVSLDESMAGRKRVFPIWPLNFEEYLDWQGDTPPKQYYATAKQHPFNTPSSHIHIVNQSLLKFITYGGYPAVQLSHNQQQNIAILSELIDAYILRDVQIWNYVANPLQIKKILTLLASNIGGLLDIPSLAMNTNLGRNALMSRLEWLQHTFILHYNRPFFTNKQKELIKNPKVYLVDTGLRNMLLQNFSVQPQTNDFGKLAENFVVTELYKSLGLLEEIFFWRTKQKQEVDVIKKSQDKLIPIEVKGGDSKEIPFAMRSFIDRYRPEKAYILNWSVVKDETFKNCVVHFRPLWFASTVD